SNSTLSANAASSGGGGIENYSTLTVSNSTLSANMANGAGNGGGIENFGALTVSNSTLSANMANGTGNAGGIYNYLGATLNLGSTIVTGNTISTGSGPNIYGVVSSLGNNLIGSTSGASGFVGSDQTNTSARLNPLAPNTPGARQTMSLPGVSP